MRCVGTCSSQVLCSSWAVVAGRDGMTVVDVGDSRGDRDGCGAVVVLGDIEIWGYIRVAG